ncbi:MAG TPA: LamG domain-containing protein, partial [Polyangiaceae bacterium]|nr:LamG domain-containing protein [Polyangiaceae bacterium]
MNYLERRRRRILANPALAALALLALAAPGCGSEGSTPGNPGAPFVETFDEDFETVVVQRDLRSGGALQAPGAAADGTGGSGTGGFGGGAAGAGGGSTAGAGGFGTGGTGAGGFGTGGTGTGGFGTGGTGTGGFGGGGTLLEGDDKSCSDGFDNDGDKLVDCADADCFDNPFVSVCGGTAGSGTGGTFTGGSGGSGGKAGSGGSGGSAGVGGAAGSGGSGEGGAAGEGGSGGGPGGVVPSGFWRFDDCSPATKTLLDSSGNNIHATRTVGTACAEGISGLAVDFDEAGDRVEALNAPQFALDQNLAVAAWVNPELTDGNRPVVLKRRNNETAFSLRVQNGQAQFTVTLDSGKTVTSAAPIAANAWSHVAGLFNGRFVFLFVNGEQVGQIFAEGSIRDVDVPVRIGSTTQTQRFVGRIDEVIVSTQPTTPADLQALSCVRRPALVTADPEAAGPVPAGTPVTYAVNVRNNDFGFCPPRDYFLSVGSPPGFSAFSDPFFVPQVPPGGDAAFSLSVNSFEDTEPQIATIPFSAVEVTTGFEETPGQVTYEVAASSGGCQVSTARELFIRNVSVVDDPVRTTFNAPPDDPRRGAWTFGRLMTDMAPSPEVAPEFVEQVF